MLQEDGAVEPWPLPGPQTLQKPVLEFETITMM